MKRMVVVVFIGYLVLLIIRGCAPTKEIVIKGWTGTAEKPSWTIGERWIYKVTDSKGDSRTNFIEYMGKEEKPVGRFVGKESYHVFLRNKEMKRYFTDEFHWAFTLIEEKEGWRDYEFFEPPNKYFDFPLRIGKKWQHDLVTTKITGDPPTPRTSKCVKEREILDYVKIEIHGKFYEAFKIEEKCQIHKTRQVIWYSPLIKNWVKRVWYNADGSWWQEELTNYEPK